MRSLVLFVLLVSLAGLAADRFRVVSVRGPEAVSPGEAIAVHLTVEVVEVDAPVYLRPFAAYSFASSRLARNLPAESMVPWKLAKFQVGDTLKVTARLTVPSGVEPGEKGAVIFRIYRPDTKKEVRLEGGDRAFFTVVAPRKVELAPSGVGVPVAVVPRLAGQPVLDGGMEGYWGKAAELPVALDSATGRPSDSPAVLKVATDGRMLYLALRAKGHGTPRRYAGHDAPVWNNDALECFLTPDLESGEYTQFIADLLGQRYDSLNGDFHGFNPPWHAAAREEGGEWCIEAAIPLDAVASGLPGDGTVWKAGFFRLGRANAGWSATLGSHNSVRRHGLLVFGSLGAALDRQCAFLPADAANGSARMRQLAARVEALRAGEARRSPTAFASAMEQLPALRAELRKLRFAEHFASSKSPLVVQPAFPYEGSVSPSGEEVAAALEADFYEGEVRDFAFHLTNVGDRAVTIRASLFGVKPEQFRLDRRTIHHLLLGIPGFPATFYAPAEVASGDGTRVADALVPNPAGVWRIAPRETVQCFFRVHSPRKAQVSEGVLLFQAIDGTPLEAPPIPVRFRTRATGALGAASKPTTLGFDFLPHEVADTRPGFARRHYQMLRDFGFNMVILSGLRDLPRPRANRDGTLVGPLDFSRLRSRLALLGTNFDHYYLNVDVWEKRTQRKDLFGLDFYDPAYETAFKQWFKVCADELKRLGVPDARLVVCPLDEAVDERAETIARWIKEACPGIRLIADCSSPDLARVRSIDRYLDVWMPHVKTLRQEALEGFHQYLRQGGKPRLLYYYCTGSNEKRKKPHEDYIVRFHEVFARGFGGLAYWAAGQYYGDPWYRRPYAGAYDTALLYPAEAGPVPSRRLAAWHRGTQDLWLLRETAARYRSDAGVLRRLSVAAQGVADYPSDYRRAEELRQYCRTLLENRR